MKGKIIVIIINAIVGALLGGFIEHSIRIKKENDELLSRISIVEKERNALSDAIRCYSEDNEDTVIIYYSHWYLETFNCPDSLEYWINIYKNNKL